MNPTAWRITFACVLTATLALAGCENPGGGGVGGRRDAGAGSAGSSKPVPKNATRIAESANSRLVHRALRSGEIWVQDATAGKVIYNGKVRADSNVVIDPKADAVTVNDIQVRHAPRLNPDHTYRLYFKGQ